MAFTLMDFNIIFRLARVTVFVCTLTGVCGVNVVVSIFTVLTLGAGAVVQALPTLPSSAVTVADGVLVHVTVTLAGLALFGRAVLSQGVSIETVITYFTTRAFKNVTLVNMGNSSMMINSKCSLQSYRILNFI